MWNPNSSHGSEASFSFCHELPPPWTAAMVFKPLLEFLFSHIYSDHSPFDVSHHEDRNLMSR